MEIGNMTVPVRYDDIDGKNRNNLVREITNIHLKWKFNINHG